MKKNICLVLTIVVGLSLVGCSQKTTTAEKQTTSSKASTESSSTSSTDSNVTADSTKVANLDDVKALILKLETYKGDAGPTNVDDLYAGIKDILSPEEQASFEKINIPNAKSGTASHFVENKILGTDHDANMQYNGKGYDGYTITSDYKWKEDANGVIDEFHSTTQVINYNGKLLVISDMDRIVR